MGTITPAAEFVVPNSAYYVGKMVYQVASKEDFKSQLEAAGDKLVVGDFYADWCGPCKMIAPHLATLETELGGAVIFLKVNVDDCDEVAMEYNISAMPTFIFFKASKKLDEFKGANLDKVKEKVNQFK